MGTELTDIFMTLHPREQWTKAKTQAELAAAIQAETAGLPGIRIVFTQPIQRGPRCSPASAAMSASRFTGGFRELVRSASRSGNLARVPGRRGFGQQITGSRPSGRVDQDKLALWRVSPMS
jgi:cobalt-zinc-cadmium resistance protein CzcA